MVVTISSTRQDVERGSYSASSWQHPAGPDQAGQALTLTLSTADLDQDGVFHLKDPADPTQPLMFLASKGKILTWKLQISSTVL